MENDLAAVKKFIYMIEGQDNRIMQDSSGNILLEDNPPFTVFEPELPAVSLESAQALCIKWHKENPHIEYKPILFFKMETC